MTPLVVFWMVFAGASLVMLGLTRLSLMSFKISSRPLLRIVLAHLIAVALASFVGGLHMPYLAGGVRWGYALALAGFGTLPWLVMDIALTKLRGGPRKSA